MFKSYVDSGRLEDSKDNRLDDTRRLHAGQLQAQISRRHVGQRRDTLSKRTFLANLRSIPSDVLSVHSVPYCRLESHPCRIISIGYRKSFHCHCTFRRRVRPYACIVERYRHPAEFRNFLNPKRLYSSCLNIYIREDGFNLGLCMEIVSPFETLARWVK
jgi:hypothetical protein